MFLLQFGRTRGEYLKDSRQHYSRKQVQRAHLFLVVLQLLLWIIQCISSLHEVVQEAIDLDTSCASMHLRSIFIDKKHERDSTAMLAAQ